MARCYGMPMEEFTKLGFGWVVRTAHVEYKRPLNLGDVMIVRTWIDELHRDSVKVHFEILKKPAGKLSASGWFEYTLVSLESGRATAIPKAIAEIYAI